MRRSSLLVLVPVLAALGCGDEGDLGTQQQEMRKVCAVGTTTPGIDVSVYQGTINWPGVKAAGKQFAFIRVNHGLTNFDTKFNTNWPAARAAGVMRGPYQYFLPQEDAVAQAQMMVEKIAAAGGLLDDDLPPVIDVEEMGGQTSATVIAKVQAWMAHVEGALGRRPVVYTGPYFWEDHALGTSFGDHPLWIAHYTTGCPLTPDAWTTWTFWQSSGSGTCGGISGAVDLDAFQGTVAQLQEFAAASILRPDAGEAGPDAAAPGPDAAAAGPDAEAAGPDAAVGLDAQASPDAGPPDAAEAPDAAAGEDAGAETVQGQGCGCASSPGTPLASTLVGFAGLAARRRRTR